MKIDRDYVWDIMDWKITKPQTVQGFRTILIGFIPKSQMNQLDLKWLNIGHIEELFKSVKEQFLPFLTYREEERLAEERQRQQSQKKREERKGEDFLEYLKEEIENLKRDRYQQQRKRIKLKYKGVPEWMQKIQTDESNSEETN